MSVNKVILIGNLGRDPETRYLDNNRVVTNFSLATSETFTDKNGEKKTDTEWHRIELWDNLAKIAEKYLKKGSQVFVEGKIKSESWKDKDGNEKTGIKIRGISITLLGSPRNSETNTPSNTAPNATMDSAPVTPDQTDDLPF